MSQRVSVSLPDSVAEWCKLRAEQQGRSVSNLIATILKERMEKGKERASELSGLMS